MAEMELDWDALQQSAATAQTFGLPIGRYPAQVDSAEARFTSTGKHMIVVRFVVRQPHQLAGKRMTRNMVLSPESPQALAIFFRQLAGLGVPGTYLRPGVDMAYIASLMVGQVCDIVVAQGKPYQGQERTEIQNIIAVSGAVPGAPGPMVAAGPPMPGAAPVAYAPPVPVAVPAPAMPAAPVVAAPPAPVVVPPAAPAAPAYVPPVPVQVPAAPPVAPPVVQPTPVAPPAPMPAQPVPAAPAFQEPAPAVVPPAPPAAAAPPEQPEQPTQPVPARPSF